MCVTLRRSSEAPCAPSSNTNFQSPAVARASPAHFAARARSHVARIMSGDASSSGGEIHEARHYQYSRKIITPTHPVEGDYLKIETEEGLFGLLFLAMAWWLFKQVRGLLGYFREARNRRAAEDMLGVDIVDEESDEDDEPDGDGGGGGKKKD